MCMCWCMVIMAGPHPSFPCILDTCAVAVVKSHVMVNNILGVVVTFDKFLYLNWSEHMIGFNQFDSAET